MDDNQRREIIRMRLLGKGYRLIAKELGLPRESVRSYCKRRGLGGRADQGLLIDERTFTRNQGVCAECGKKLEQPTTGRRRIFCSDACRRQWWNHNPDLIKRKAYYHLKCLHCGKEFAVYGNKNRKYCSYECYIQDRFYKNEESHMVSKRAAMNKVREIKSRKKREGLPAEIVDAILDDVIKMIQEEE